MNAKIKELLSEYETNGDFTYATPNSLAISDAEKKLGFQLDSSFMEFITEYGHGGIGGIEVFGIGKNGELVFVNETMKYREYGLPKNLLVIENCDEWIYCIDSSNEKIVFWNANGPHAAYDSFDEYLVDRFSDAAENM